MKNPCEQGQFINSFVRTLQQWSRINQRKSYYFGLVLWYSKHLFDANIITLWIIMTDTAVNHLEPSCRGHCMFWNLRSKLNLAFTLPFHGPQNRNHVLSKGEEVTECVDVQISTFHDVTQNRGGVTVCDSSDGQVGRHDYDSDAWSADTPTPYYRQSCRVRDIWGKIQCDTTTVTSLQILTSAPQKLFTVGKTANPFQVAYCWKKRKMNF